MTGRAGEAFRRHLPATLAALLFPVLILCLINTPATARTVVTKTGDCSVTVTIKIEIHGPLGNQETANKWKEQIEAQWNGPSKEVAQQIALQEGIIQPIPEDATEAQRKAAETRNNDLIDANRQKILDKYKEMMDAMGTGTKDSAMVNCCAITFVADVKVRGDEATDGYHQVEAVPTWEEREVDGEMKRVKNRSFVRMTRKDGAWALDGQNTSTTGRWRADDAGWPPEAHEVGHLMGLDDQYEDRVGADGKTHSHTHQGHEADLMANNLGFPHEAGLKQILDIAGIECDCCPNTAVVDRYFVAYGRTSVVAMDAIAACNIEVLNQVKADLEDQLRNLPHVNMPRAKRIELYKLLNDRLNQVKKAIEDCPDREGAITTPPVGVITGAGYGMSSDSTEWCTYGGGTVSPPVITGVPDDGDDPGDGSVATPTGGTPTGPGDDDDPGDGPAGTPTGGTPTGPGDSSTPIGPFGTPIFDDGFESGDTTIWSDTPTSTPVDDGDDPKDTPDKDQPSKPTTTLKIKAKASVLQSDGTQIAKEEPGRRLKLISPSLKDPPLAMTDDKKDDADADKDPMQCTTGNDGSCEIDVPKQEIAAGLAAGGMVDPNATGIPNELEMEVTGNKIQSHNVVVPEGATIPKEVRENADDEVTIDGTTYMTFNVGYTLGAKYDFGSNWKLQYGLDWNYEENLCVDEQPGPPVGTFEQITEKHGGIPGARLRLSLGEGGAP